MINAISQSNCVISPLINKPGVRYSPVNFTALPNQNKQDSKEIKQSLLTGAILGAAIGLAAIVHKEIKVNKLKKMISKRYDDIWVEVLKSIDTTKIQIEKPKLKFSRYEKSNHLADYSSDNKITVNLHHFKTREYVVYNDRGDIITSGDKPLFTLKEIKKKKKDGLIDSSWTVKKLNDNEKLLDMSFLLAHEIRHCVQNHFILNDSNFGPNYLLLKDIAEEWKKAHPNLSQDELLKVAKKKNPYWANFKPKGDYKNLELRSSATVGGEKIYFSTEELVKSFLNYTPGEKDFDKYSLNALEVDANAYAITYLQSHPDLKEGCDNIITKIIINKEKRTNSKNFTNYLNISRNNTP